MQWKVISNEKQLTGLTKQILSNHFLKYIEALISWFFPASHRVLMFAIFLFQKWSFYILLLPDAHTNALVKNPFRQKDKYHSART